ncbi:MAG: NUDIX hydrolase [Chloroflexi bacterium]|nr:NUDIX hydrolase [Chloroflexota bacterium]
MSRSAVSAGGIVFRRAEEGVEIILVGRTADRLWALPKGTPDPGETLEETALREVREETGLEVRIVDTVGQVEYWYTAPDGNRLQKTVHYYLMEPTGGDTANHDHEFDLVEWRHLAEAERLLTHKNQLPMLHRAWEQIGRIPA